MACVVTIHVFDAAACLYDIKEGYDSYFARLRNEHKTDR